MYTIRPFDFESGADYEQVAALDLAVWPDDPSLASEWKRVMSCARRASTTVAGWLKMETGTLSGKTVHEPWWSPEVGKFQLDLRVHPTVPGMVCIATCTTGWLLRFRPKSS